MPEVTETQDLGLKPRRRKNKEIHNAVERHRKDKINAGINRIGNLLPCSQALKQSKNMILDQAYRYITELKKQNDTMLLEGSDKGQAEEIRRLRRQMEELRKESGHYIELLKAHDINFLDDPSIHWKGKMRCAKVAKVTPTHQPTKGIIIYSNGNTPRPAGKEPSSASDDGKQPAEAVVVPPPSDIMANGALQQVNSSPSSAPALLPGSTLPCSYSAAVRVVEADPSVSYITVQGLCPLPTAVTTAALLPPTSLAPSLPAAAVACSATQLPRYAVLPQAVTTAAPRTLSYAVVPSSAGLLGAGAAGSTQTTWTTLQLTGNTVQPVYQGLPAPEAGAAAGQTVQQVTVCPMGAKPAVQPIHIQVRPPLPLQHAHIQALPSVQPALLAPPQPQVQPVLAPQPQCTVLPQAAIVPQPAVPRPPQTALNPQAPPLPPPQAAVLPLLQTMQVLQVNPATAPQSTNSPSVVILQQANPCPAQAGAREDLANQTPCQHIVIIQAPNQAKPGPQNHQGGVVPGAVPGCVGIPGQIVSTGCTTSTTAGLHTVGGKQLVHILPRPAAPPAQASKPVTAAPPAAAAPAPQTITVNGQVFALQPMKTSDKGGSSQSAQSTLQLVQPTTREEPTTNVALKSLGALSSLNQSISQGLPPHAISSQGLPPHAISSQGLPPHAISSQGCGLQLAVAPPPPPPPPPSYSVVQQQPAVSVSDTFPARQPACPGGTPAKPRGGRGAPGAGGRASRRKPGAVLAPKRAAAKRAKPTRRKEPKKGRGAVAIAAKPPLATREGQTAQLTPSQDTPLASVAADSPPVGAVAHGAASSEAPAHSTATDSAAPAHSTATDSAVNSTHNTLNIISLYTLREPAASKDPPTENRASCTGTTPLSHSTSVATGANSTHSEGVGGSVVAEVAAVGPTAVKPVAGPAASSQSEAPTALTAAPHKLTVPQSRTTARASGSPAGPQQGGRSAVACSTESGHAPGATVTTTAACRTLLASATGSPETASGLSLPSTQLTPSACHAQPLPHPAPPLSLSSPSVTAPPTTSPSEFRKRAQANPPASTQRPDATAAASSVSHAAVLRLTDVSGREREPQRGEGHVGPRTDAPARNTSAPPQPPHQAYPLDHQVMEQPLTSGNRQTDSPMSAGTAGGGGRGFSVASMLPQGHGVSAGASFGAFAFTSEQAEILALAMLEQDGPASANAPHAPTPAAPPWEPPKSHQAPGSKDRVAGQQAKVAKVPMEAAIAKPPPPPVPTQVNVRSQAGEAGARHPQGAPYSQSQSHSHTQSQAQSGTVATLSVNNLIRSSSSQQQPYPGSPRLAGRQGSAPSPAALLSQPPSSAAAGLPPCSGGSGQLGEYAPLKSALLRTPGGVGAGGERHVKDASKRPAQDDSMLPAGNKRPKACPSATAGGGGTGRMEAKAPDRGQSGMLMASQLPPSSSSAVMARINPDGVGALFSGNSFMGTVLRPADAHCAPQGAAQQQQEQSQPGVLHLPQGHPQHTTPQPGQHLVGGNPYLKQQQQQDQRHHLYQLQHHLGQPDAAQLHSLHQRALQQEQQHAQHAQQKKRGLVRGGQSGPPVGLQQKQHHLEKAGVQHQQHQQQQQQQTQPQHQQQHAQQQSQQQQQQQQHQQQTLQQSQHQQQQSQHQQQQSQHQQHQQQQQTQHQQQQQQQSQTQHQQQQQQHPQQQHPQQQSSLSRHQHLQQHLQHFGARHQEKSCEAPAPGPRAHHSSHLAQQDHLEAPAPGPRAHHSSHLAPQEHLKAGQDHSAMQRLMSSRTLEQQLISQPSNIPGSRPSDLACAPSRQERHRVSSYSAEALIGKSSSSGEQQQRMGLHLQATRGTAPEQPDLRGYLDSTRGKGNLGHNPRLGQEHPGPADVQRVSECPPFKALGGGGGGGGGHQLGGFEVQVSRGDMAPKSVPASQRGLPGQQQGGFRMGVGPPGDGRPRGGGGGYGGPHPGAQGGVQIGAGLSREQEGCHQSFMQSLLSPHLPEQAGHQRATQCCPPVSMEYSCLPSAGDMQAKASSPSQAPGMRLAEGNKGHIPQGGGNMHGGPGVRSGLPTHPPPPLPPPHSSSEPGRSSAPSSSRPPPPSQRSRHLAQEGPPAKLRPGDRPRPGALRPGHPFEHPEGHLPLPPGGGVLLGRPQAGGGGEAVRRGSIVRFMADGAQVGGDNNLVPDQHLAQNFGFPFIADGGMNPPPPPINANSTFIPPVSQPGSSRTPALLPVEPQNTLPSFYPSYSPAAHPSLPSDIPLQYFSNQMFTSPGADKAGSAPLNNRFGSILSPPRPVGFAQASFPLLPDMPPMPIANSSGITPHLSNFSLTSLFPEIATAMPADGAAMPMSPLLSLSNAASSSADPGKQPNRPAHNISHILGHDGSSAV